MIERAEFWVQRNSTLNAGVMKSLLVLGLSGSWRRRIMSSKLGAAVPGEKFDKAAEIS